MLVLPELLLAKMVNCWILKGTAFSFSLSNSAFQEHVCDEVTDFQAEEQMAVIKHQSQFCFMDFIGTHGTLKNSWYLLKPLGCTNNLYNCLKANVSLLSSVWEAIFASLSSFHPFFDKLLVTIFIQTKYLWFYILNRAFGKGNICFLNSLFNSGKVNI